MKWPLAGFAALLALLAASCGGGDAAPSFLLYGTEAGIVERDLDSGETHVVVPVPASHTLRDPAVSPDGSRIAYIDAPPLRRVQGVLDSSSDVWIANRDGSDARMLYERQALAESASLPRWADDNTVMFVLRTLLDPSEPTGGADYRIARLDVTSGAVTETGEGAFQFDIAPGRTKIAYLAAESPDEQPLYVANVDGSEPVRLLDTAGSGLEGFSAVTFSSDGQSILLAAHMSPGAMATHGVKLASLLHTAPLDLYRVPIDGSGHTLVAATQVDGPGLAPGPGDDVYLLAGKLLHVDLASGEVTQLDDPARYGGLAYIED